MQLRAFTKKNEAIFAHQAAKQVDYACLECRGIVRLRGGFHRQKHFYHLCSSSNCRQHGKSMEHIQVQSFIQQILGKCCQLEFAFPSIGRIADCVWFDKKIVFEIQCSSIPQAEVQQRNKDYLSEGYRVVWILHEKKFNQRRLSAAEVWLADHPHYFTNIDSEGNGYIYDQYSRIFRGIQELLLDRVPVAIQAPYVELEGALPCFFEKRWRRWGLGFQGDWMDKAGKEDCRHLFLPIEEENAPSSPSFRSLTEKIWRACLRRPYEIAFAYLLEKACR